MNNTQFFVNLKSTRPDAYETLKVVAGSLKYFSPKYNNERCLAIIHTYGVLKIALLKQGFHKGNFLNSTYLDMGNRKKESLSFKCLTRRQLRKWEAKRAKQAA